MFLDDIIRLKKKEIASIRQNFGPQKVSALLNAIPSDVRDFRSAITGSKVSLIAEMKKASPSAGVIVDDYQPEKLAEIYFNAGASAISVLTEEKYFMGFVSDVKKVRDRVNLPVLRKDFIIDESQVYQSRICGADAVLLIVRILEKRMLKKLIELSKELSLCSLTEVHTPDEAKVALDEGAELIGINNRDLNTLKVDIHNVEKIMAKVPDLKKNVIVAESGIRTREDVEYLSKFGVKAVLVGEAILKSLDVEGKIKELLGKH